MSTPVSNVAAPEKWDGYSWQEMHADLEKGNYLGTFGADNAAYHALAGIRAGVDMTEYHSKRSPDEYYVEELADLIKNPKTQRRWNEIITMDPMGMFATRPTQSATTAKMEIPELMQGNQLEPDGKIVNDDLSINCVKCAIDLCWNLPHLATRLNMDETLMREKLAQYTQNDRIAKDVNINTYLPPVGGTTLYFFGDISKLNNESTEVAVRVHDECCGSDVFGTDICTCRPYLIFALLGAVQCAQRGGVGIIAYFRKEGRSLGEVTKFRVYNARKTQKGGDTAENYFKQTESIAGIRDARFQEMMPDVFLWLGINRIDWLLSMSADKYDAITAAGIEVMQRVPLPDSYVPAGATVEITAKISAGYHSEAVADHSNIAAELRELSMIRKRTGLIYDLAKQGKSKHWALHPEKLDDAVKLVIDTTNANYKNVADIPYHSRWRHFLPGSVNKLMSTWKCDKVEVCRRLIDLATISVLMDAGAGPQWHYMDHNSNKQIRSEGLAIASFDMFTDGLFSSDAALPSRVNSLGLKNLSLKAFAKGLQINEENNKMTGLTGRYELLQRLAEALEANPVFFGEEVHRPGNIIDYLLAHQKDNHVSLSTLWRAVIVGFESIWPQHLSGVRRGDVWSYSMLKEVGLPGSDLIPFHKLSQWLTYSLLEPIQQLGLTIDDMDLMTGLAEYRNGGLFIDTGVLVPKNPETFNMTFDAGNELIVEWRALTIQLIDAVWEKMLAQLKLTKAEFPLAKVLQGGTWAAGRVIAAQKRADKSPPLSVRLDGTVF